MVRLIGPATVQLRVVACAEGSAIVPDVVVHAKVRAPPSGAASALPSAAAWAPAPAPISSDDAWATTETTSPTRIEVGVT